MKNKTLNIILLITIFTIFSCKEKKETQKITKNDNESIYTEINKTVSEKEKQEKFISKEKKQDENINETEKETEMGKQIDPFHSGDLYDNYNQNQIDFSNEFLKIEIEHYKKVSTEVTTDVSNYEINTSRIFETGNNYQNGVLGKNYKRIKMFITTSKKIVDLDYLLAGKSDVNGNVSFFDGKIRILKIFEIKKDYDYEGQGEMIAEYTLYENPDDKYSGVFKGVFECSIIVNHKDKKIEFDDAWEIADGYANRTYVGTWKDYKTKRIKTCIWGDYRLPFTFDFDQGDGEMFVNEKYVNNGWKSFNNRTEETK